MSEETKKKISEGLKRHKFGEPAPIIPKPKPGPGARHSDELRELAIQKYIELGELNKTAKAVGVPAPTLHHWIFRDSDSLRTLKRDRAEKLGVIIERAMLKVANEILNTDRYAKLDAIGLSVVVKNLGFFWLQLNNPDLPAKGALIKGQETMTDDGVKKMVTRSFEAWVASGNSNGDGDSGEDSPL